MKTQLALAAGFAGLLVARSVFPCGAPFGTGINVNPQQDIIVVHKGGVETYVTVTACSGGRGGIGTTGAAGGTSGSNGGPVVVATGRVGFLDWAQLKADTVASFTDWLTTNGYPFSTASSSVFSYYVQKGWYFVAFKISQGGVPDGGSGMACNALGPVKLSFASAVPVVPSRMATASAPPTSYGTGFSWRIFGITPGDQQLGFANGASSNGVFGYSGALAAADVPSLAGLALAGDRLSKLTLTFSYASTDPDVGLSLASAVDYREVRTITQYVVCDAGRDAPVDAISGQGGETGASPDLQPRPARDADSFSERAFEADALSNPVLGFDAVPSFVPDALLETDTSTQVVADARTSPDTEPQVVPDAGTKPDAALALASVDAASGATSAPTPGLSARGSGCSVAGGSASGGLFALALLALAGRIRRRRKL